VRTPTAKINIRRALKQRQKTAKGREIIDNLLQKELEAYGLPEIPEEEIERFLEATARYFNYPDLRALYLDIADPRRSPGSRKPPSPNRIVACLIASHLADHIAKANGEPVGIPKHRIKFAQCRHNGELCRVTSGSEIVGRIVNQGTPHERLIVYRRDCPTAAKVGADIPLMWLGDRRPGKPVRVLIETVDRPRLLDDVLHTVYDLYDEGLYLLEVQAKVTRDRAAHISLTIDAPSYDAVTRLSEALHQLKEHGILDEEPRIDALSPIEKMLLAEPDTLPNPYTTGPVRDRRVFKGRDAELQQIVSCVRGDQNLVVLYGINRIGKTSLLRYLHAHVAEEYDLVPILLDMPFLTKNEEAQFWLEIAAKVEEAVAHLYKGTAGRFKRLRKKNGDDTFVHFRDWLAKAQSLLKGRKLLIMIDEWNVLDELWDRDAALLLIYRLKSLVEGHPDLAFVLCVQETLYKKAASDATKVPSWPLLRAGLPVRLGYLRRPAAERLIREPIGQMLQYDAAVVEEILYLTACHPYYLQNVLLLLIHHINQMRMSGQKGGIPRVTYEDLDTVIPQLLDSGEHLFNDFLRECRGFKGTVLCALAHVSQERHRGATAEELQTVLQQQGYRVQPSSLARNLRMLCEAGILERRQQRGQLRYRIRVPLFERWLLENRPLSPKAR
jgi:DNA-binding HxlR family transcriptional regulator